MAAPKGNQFWKYRAKHGRSKIFSSPKQLWDAACEYFQWVEDNPLMESELVKFQGEATVAELPKMRAMTLNGLCFFLKINSKYFYEFESNLDLETKQGKDFSDIIANIKDVIYQQKFEGASANMLNPNIIARDLGLVDKKDLGHTSSDVTPWSEVRASVDKKDG